MVDNTTGVCMSGTAFDGFYTPAPADVPRDSRWPWVVVAAGVVIVIAGAVGFSGGAADREGGSGTAQTGSVSSAQQ
jgi:hypothetical protein